MVARDVRLADFTTVGTPRFGTRFEVLCEDHVGTYTLPFLCEWDGAWHNVETGATLEVTIVGWRQPPPRP